MGDSFKECEVDIWWLYIDILKQKRKVWQVEDKIYLDLSNGYVDIFRIEKERGLCFYVDQVCKTDLIGGVR